MQKTKVKKRNILFIGLLSFFGGISQDIFVPLLPLYLSNILGFSKEFIGFTEGLVTSSASVFKVVAGYFSDKLRNRKYIVFLGYFLSMVSRPLLAFAAIAPAVSILRFLDGAGKGIKDTPKDALIADSSQTGTRGKSFGIARMLDTLGSVVGPILLFGLLFIFGDSAASYKYIIILSAVPLIITLLIIAFKIKDTHIPSSETATSKGLISLPRRFYFFLLIMLVFGLGNSSDTFLILRAENVGAAALTIPLIYAFFNFVYASASVPLGSLSDRIGREKVILIGWVAYSFSYLGFGLANEPYQIWLLFGFYGLYYATTEGVAKALVADLVDPTHRGRAYGIYNTLIGLIALPAGLIAGLLWERVGSSAPFLFGAGMSAFAMLLLVAFISFNKKQLHSA